MANQAKGVIAGSVGAAVTLEDILVPDPGPGEALVRVQACGVCHTDLHYREGAINDEFPFSAGARGGRGRRGDRRWCNQRCGRGLCNHCLAGPLRQLPFLPARPSLVLLRQ